MATKNQITCWRLKQSSSRLHDVLPKHKRLHRNIKGEKFFELHLKFEELYANLLLKVDEVAERILTLGATPLHTFDDYKSTAKIKSVMNVCEGKQGVQAILEAFEIIIVPLPIIPGYFFPTNRNSSLTCCKNFTHVFYCQQTYKTWLGLSVNL